MSDTKTLNLTSLVTKKTRRAKARLLQNFGKADKTTDELFEVYQSNFNRQQITALNLQKHVKHFVHCLKELNEASKGLSQCLMEMHEKDWPKHDVFENNAYEMDHINEDLEERLKESVLSPLEQYLGQFAEMREKIAKRGRKLVDYDDQRHSFEALQQHQSNKQHDDTKLSKYRDQLDEARKVYESLNNELHDELPALYDNRLPFIITVFQRLFSSKISYHNESVAVHKSYMETVELLAKASERGNFDSASIASHQIALSKKQLQTTTNITSNNTTATTQPDCTENLQRAIDNSSQSEVKSQHPNGNKMDDQQEHVDNQAVKSTNKPPVYLHKVRATYKYICEDEDELSFEAGEIIQVIEYDDPAEQEDGWLMGIKMSTGQKGLFPANFTKEIQIA